MATPRTGPLGVLTTKGDIVAFDGTDVERQAVGADGEVLTADSSTATGLGFSSKSRMENIFIDGRIVVVVDAIIDLGRGREARDTAGASSAADCRALATDAIGARATDRAGSGVAFVDASVAVVIQIVAGLDRLGQHLARAGTKGAARAGARSAAAQADIATLQNQFNQELANEIVSSFVDNAEANANVRVNEIVLNQVLNLQNQ